MKGETFKIHLEPNAVPFSVTTPRRIPLPLVNSLRKELQDLQDLGITRPVTTYSLVCSDCRSTQKGSGSDTPLRRLSRPEQVCLAQALLESDAP